MSIHGLAHTMIGIVLMSALAGCLQPPSEEPVDTATASLGAGDAEVTSASSPVETSAGSTYLCRYLCPEIPKIFNGFSNYPAQACLYAETACQASCTSCEFFEIIARCPECP